MTAPRIYEGGPLAQAQFAFDGTLAVAVGDLMYHDSNDVKPASSQSDGGTEYLNQRAFARNFAGVSMETRTTSETSALTAFPVATDLVATYDCVSATFEYGNMVAIDEADSGTALEKQKLVKTTDGELAIGYAVERQASATTRIKVRLVSNVAPHKVKPAGLFPFGSSVQTIDMNDATVTLTMDGATGTKITANMLFVDPNGNNEALVLPPEAQSIALPLFIVNTGGEHIAVKEDANSTTIVTIEDNEAGWVVCDGTTWYGFTGQED